MECRKLGRTGLDVSAIGLGTEHLEKRKETMEEVLRTAVDAGVNYIDLLYIDPTGSDADFWGGLGPAVRYYRDSLILAVHWGTHDHNMDESQRCFEDVLSQMGNGYAEVAIIQVIDSERQWNGWGQKSAERLLRYKEQGRIGHIGTSCHFESVAIKAVNSGLIDVLMVPISLVSDSEKIVGLCQACVEQQVGLVAMKPYWGGGLFSLNGKPTGITPTQCLAYVLSHPVSTTVPGVSNVEHLRAALHYLEATDEEKDYHSAIKSMPTVWRGYCLKCGHCRPCPQDIDIVPVIEYVNLSRIGISLDILLDQYATLEVKASQCTECGVCVERCPFDVDIIAKMREAVEIFEASSAQGERKDER